MVRMQDCIISKIKFYKVLIYDCELIIVRLKYQGQTVMLQRLTKVGNNRKVSMRSMRIWIKQVNDFSMISFSMAHTT